MKKLVTIGFGGLVLGSALVMSACSQDTVRPEESVQVKLSRETALGKAPCKLQVIADGKVVFSLESQKASVTCALPNFAVPESSVEEVPVESPTPPSEDEDALANPSVFLNAPSLGFTAPDASNEDAAPGESTDAE